MPRRVGARIGRRGAALLVFAWLDVVIGWSLIDSQGQAQAKAIPAYRAFLLVMPFEAWGYVWLAAGLACALFAFRRNDAAGFVAAIAVKSVWAAGFFAAWLIYGVPRAWLGGVTWAVLAGLVVLISGWPEPPKKGQLGIALPPFDEPIP